MSDVVRGYYDSNVEEEWNRLQSPYRQFEFASTMRLIEDYLPSEGRIIDIGGGPGRYAIALARRGFRVTLIDLAPGAIASARRRFEEASLSADAFLCRDACDLHGLESDSFDAALMLGPMYHLVEANDRARALASLHRVLKVGAPAVVGFINPWGLLRSGLTEFPDIYEDADAVRALLSTCMQRGEQEAFTEAAFLTPPHAVAELRSAGFSVDARAGVEGFASGMIDAVETMASRDPAAYAHVLRLVAETCDHPAYRDCTEHLHVVVRKISGDLPEPSD